MAQPTISIGRYFATHGKRPQGYGRWVFKVIWDVQPYGSTYSELSFEGTYTNAKQQLKGRLVDDRKLDLLPASISLLS